MRDNSLFTTLSLFFIICTIALYWSTTSLQKKENALIQKVGTKFVLEKDTLTIVDYSLLDKTFTLSNGKKISSELILKSK